MNKLFGLKFNLGGIDEMVNTSLGPPKASWILNLLGKMVYALSGWKFEGKYPDNAKSVVIFAPHTTNWDFLYMVFGLYYLGVKPTYLAKKELFFWPAKYFFHWTGGVPVDRRKSQNLVEATAQIIKEKDQILIGVAPEATRGKTKYWKSGFYHIANIAEVPIHFAYVDYPRKVTGVTEGIMPTGEVEADMAKIRAFYKDRIDKGKYPTNVAEIGFKPK